MEIYQGNTNMVCIDITNEDGSEYVLQDGDVLYFTVKREAILNATVLLKKKLTNNDYDEDGKLLLTLLPEDTANMNIGTYKFDCAVHLADGEFYTIIPPSNFDVIGVVTEYEV